MEKTMKLFRTILLFITFIFFGWIANGTITRLLEVSAGDSKNTILVAGTAVFITIQLFLLIYLLFKKIDRLDDSKQTYVKYGLLAVMTVILAVLLTQFYTRPLTDSFDDLDTAAYLIKYGPVTKDLVHYCMKIFGNNYALTLLFAGMLKVFSMFVSADRILLPFYIINAGVILLSAWLLWKIAKKVSGKRTANKALLLCAMNPVYYGVTFWIYSLLYSIPVLLGIILAGICLYRSEKAAVSFGWGLLLGLLTVAGYELRPTCIFPIIASAFLILWVLTRETASRKKLLTAMLAFVLAAGVSFFSVSSMTNQYFSEIKEYNFPVFYWLSMGSHGNGDLSSREPDEKLAIEAITIEERSAALKQSTIENYKANGISGTVNLWMRKTDTTWADGYSSQRYCLFNGEPQSKLFEFLGGSRSQLYEIYCQAYRLLLEAGILLFCLKSLTGRKMNKLSFLLLITQFGGLFFYLFWEAKNIYSAQFIPVMILLAIYGMEGDPLFELSLCTDAEKAKTLKNSVYITAAVITAVIWTSISRIQMNYAEAKIFTSVNDRSTVPLTDESELQQDFYISGYFNQLNIMAEPSEGECSKYSVSLCDESGDVLLDEVIEADQISNNKLILNTADSKKDAHWYLTLRKLEPEKESILFYSKNSYFLDQYRGHLISDVKTDYVADLEMDVVCRYRGRYFSRKMTALLLALYTGFSALILYLMCDRKRV